MQKSQIWMFLSTAKLFLSKVFPLEILVERIKYTYLADLTDIMSWHHKLHKKTFLEVLSFDIFTYFA